MSEIDEALKALDTIPNRPILPPGTQTQWGKIAMVGVTGGERYYWMSDGDGAVAMIPAFIVEQQHDEEMEDNQ